MLIGIVALVVIGPERLPKVARTAGQWLGKLNRYVSQVKQDIDRDIKLDELRKMQQEMKETAQRYEILAGETKREVEEAVVEETGQISRVMQAMSATDGGLSMKEWDKIKAEEAAAAGTGPAAQTQLTDAGEAQNSVGTSDGPHAPISETATSENVPSAASHDAISQTDNKAVGGGA